MWLFFGLGNPGPSYRFTRHNAGFILIEKLEKEWKIPLDNFSFSSLWGKRKLKGSELVLAKPLTFMNRSGEAAKALAGYFKLSPSDILVVCDDLDLPLGKMRLRKKGGSGGHRGLKSIIDLLGTEDFPRLRLGIGRPEEKGREADYVLSPFSQEEWEVFSAVLERAVGALEEVITSGLETAMSKFNN